MRTSKRGVSPVLAHHAANITAACLCGASLKRYEPEELEGRTNQRGALEDRRAGAALGMAASQRRLGVSTEVTAARPNGKGLFGQGEDRAPAGHIDAERATWNE